jgi:hypothetical protein
MKVEIFGLIVISYVASLVSPQIWKKTLTRIMYHSHLKQLGFVLLLHCI